MSALARFLASTHVALIRPLGRVDVVPVEAFARMPLEAIENAVLRPLTRAEAIRLRNERRRRAA